MEKMDLYKKIALEIKEKLGANHVSIILQLDSVDSKRSLGQKLPQLLIIVKNFDKFTLMMITNVLQEYPNELEIPYVVEYKDVQGMLDSIPKSFLDIKMNYVVLTGEDVTEMIKPPSYEHFRAQTELTLRNDILQSRRNLISVMAHQMSTQELLKELSIVSLNSIRNYYQIVEPKLRTTEELIRKFGEDFPEGSETLERILEYTYQTIKGLEVTEDDQLQLILFTFDNILQPILLEIDELGIEFEKTLAKESEKLSYEEFREKYSDEIKRLQTVIYQQFEKNNKKEEHILRGELELKYRKREKRLIDSSKDEITELRSKYEKQIAELQNSFEDELGKKTEEFIEKRLVEEHEKMEDEYQDKLKKFRDELEFKYITTDLTDKEQKLRSEFIDYEKRLRDNYNALEKDLRHELGIKEKNYKESMELEYKGKLEEEKEKMRKDYLEEIENAVHRNLKKQERRYESEMAKREKALEKSLRNEFGRREKELLRQFKNDIHLRERELKIQLQLEFERQKGKLESKKSEELLNLIEKEIFLRYKEIDKIQGDLVRVLQTDGSINTRKHEPYLEPSRSFISPPKDDEAGEDKDLFSKILRDNLSLKSGMRKKNIKKVS